MKCSEEQKHESVSLNEQIERKVFTKVFQNVSFRPGYVSINVRGQVLLCVCVVGGCKIVRRGEIRNSES